MTDEADRQSTLTSGPRNVRFVELSGEVMSVLLDGDLSAAGTAAGVTLTDCFLTDRARWLWQFRLGQMEADPGHARWMARQAIVGDEGLVVGHAGFHGPPDEVDMVEIGYFIGLLRGYSGVHAGEESDSCGAGQRARFRPQGGRSCPDPQV